MTAPRRRQRMPSLAAGALLVSACAATSVRRGDIEIRVALADLVRSKNCCAEPGTSSTLAALYELFQ